MRNCPFCKKLSNVFEEGSPSYYHCSACDLYFQDPKDTLSNPEEKDRYSLHTNDPEDPNYINYLKNSCSLLLPYLKNNMHGLDYGSGPGPGMQQVLNGIVEDIQNYDPYFAPELPINSSFDFITCIEAIEHFNLPYREFERWEAMTKPGSLLLIRTEFYQKQDRFESWYYSKDPTHICFFTESFFKNLKHWELLESNGKNQVLLQRN